MTTEQKIAYLKADKADIDKANAVANAVCTQFRVSEAEFAIAKAARAKAATASAPRPGQFNPALFTPATVTAIHAANSKGKFLPDANDADYSDDSDDDDSTAAHVKRAQNHLEACDEDMCERAPSDGSPDHMALAHKHLTEALEMRGRGQRRADAGRRGFVIKAVGVRFAS
jgi:hypothetical protein